MTREEAIKILKARPYSGEVLEALETLVPEYNESEDEKIRKTLLDYFSCTGDDKLMLNGVYIKDIIAYLEKMKEKEEGHDEIPVESTIEYRIGKKDGFIEGLEQGKKQFYWKPTEEDIRLFNKAVTTNTSLSPQERAQLDIVRMKFKHCPYIKQKSEWSEDDKKTIDEICNVIVANSKDGYLGRYSACELVGKLKSLCPQPKQEWSKEDEKMLLSIINAFRDGAVSTIGQEQWLKSLPERFNLQPKQEWSKKDEKMLAVISYKISQHQGNDDRSLFTPDEAEFICEMEDKFKSLLENEKASEENILDKPNNVNDVKFPFKAKIKANNKTVIISFGRLNKDRNQWIMYISDYTNNFKEYMPKELELIKDE